MRAIEQIVAIHDANTVRSVLTARKKGFKTTLSEIEEQWKTSKHKIFDKDLSHKKRKKIRFCV